MPPEPSNLITIERSVLVGVLEHAAAAARIVGHLDGPAVEPLADHVDAIVHELTELLAELDQRDDDDERTEVRRTFSLRARGAR